MLHQDDQMSDSNSTGATYVKCNRRIAQLDLKPNFLDYPDKVEQLM